MDIQTGSVRRTASITFTLAADEAACIEMALDKGISAFSAESPGAIKVKGLSVELVHEVMRHLATLRKSITDDENRPRAAAR